MSTATHPRERRAPAIAAQARSVVCPKCGNALDFHSDSQGYGVTVEQCENPRCDHWCTLERAVRPELARAPRSEELPRSRMKNFRAGGGRHGRPLVNRIMAALPTRVTDAMSSGTVAARMEHDATTVRVRLGQLFQDGHPGLRRVNVAAIGKRPRWFWWKAP